MTNGPGFTKRELYNFFYKYKGRLVRAFLIPFSIVFLISFIPTPRFHAESVLIVRMGSEYVYQPETGTQSNGSESTIPFNREQMFKSEVAILGSDELHAEVINAIGLDTIYPDIRHPTGMNYALHIIGRVVNRTLETLGLQEPMTQKEIERRQLAKAVVLFDKRLDILLEKESAVINVTFQHSDPALAVRTLTLLLQSYAEKRRTLYLEPRLGLARTQMEATRAQAKHAEAALEAFKLSSGTHSFADERSQLLQHRDDILKQSLVYSSAGLSREAATLNHKLAAMDAMEETFNTLQHEAQVAADSYGLYAHKLDEAKAYEELQHDRTGGVRIIQAPSVPADPKKWQWIIILAGSFLSLVSVMLTAIWTEFSAHGYLTPESIERSLGLPVLAVLPLHHRGQAL